MSPLFEACAANGIMPLPTVADGDCGADVCCSWSGVVQDRRHRTAMRGYLAHLMRQYADKDLRIRVFDDMLTPRWQDLAADMAAGPFEIEADDAAAPAGHGALKPEPGGQEFEGEVSRQDQLRSAIRWAAAGDKGDQSILDAEVDGIIAGLSAEKQDG